LRVYAHEQEPAKKPVNAQLFNACRQNDVAAATRALADGAELDIVDETRMTPLTEAYRARAFEVGRLLVEQGASVNVLMGISKVPSATQAGMIELTGENPALNFAIEAKHVDSVQYLLRSGADPNLFGQMAKAPLVTAVEQRNRQIVEMLLDAGADPNFCGLGRPSALSRALVLGDADLVDLLQARGANLRAQRFEFISGYPDPVRLGPSLLMSAAAGGNVALILKMIAAGQDPKFVSTEGVDALASAAASGHLPALELLLPLIERSPRALEVAQKQGHHQIIERLRRAGYQ
jgi:ankyrin repeat protein